MFQMKLPFCENNLFIFVMPMDEYCFMNSWQDNQIQGI